MAKPDEEQASKLLFEPIDESLRPIRKDFYDFLASDESVFSGAGEYGPNALTDSIYDRMLHERPVLKFVVGRLGRSSLTLVLRDAAQAERRAVEKDELPHLIISSLARVRRGGEWDNSAKMKELRKGLLADALLTPRISYPIIAETFTLSEALQYDDHEEYALDAIAATSKWLDKVSAARSHLKLGNNGNDAA